MRPIFRTQDGYVSRSSQGHHPQQIAYSLDSLDPFIFGESPSTEAGESSGSEGCDEVAGFVAEDGHQEGRGAGAPNELGPWPLKKLGEDGTFVVTTPIFIFSCFFRCSNHMDSPSLFPESKISRSLRFAGYAQATIPCQASALLQLCSAYCARGELKRGLGDQERGDVRPIRHFP